MISWIKKRKWNIISLILAMALAASCGAFTYYGTFEEFDGLLIDEVTQQFDIYKTDVPIRMIAIDKETVERLGSFDSWSRQVSADVINILNSGEEKPVIIGMDLLYENERDVIGDTAFVNACEQAGNVCLAVKDGEPPTKEIPEDGRNTGERPVIDGKSAFAYPYEALRDVVQIGISDSFEIADNEVIREFQIYAEDNEKKMGSFAVGLYKGYQAHAGREVKLKVKSDGVVRFNYSRRISEYETYSFIDVLNGTIEPEVFANTIVIIGDYTEEDRRNVPIAVGGQMPDAGLQANIVEALLSQKVVYKLPSNVIAAIYGMLIFVCYTYVFLLKGRKSVVGAIFVLIIHFQLAFFLRNRYYPPVVALWLFSLLAIVLGLFIAFSREKENTEHLQKALETYVEADVVDEIINNAAYDIKLGGEKKDIAVLFVDIRGFTSLSELLEPEEMVMILNKYFEMVSRSVIKNGGDIDKFIGDAAMAMFNAPKDLDDYVLKAVQTALDILEEASILKNYCMETYGKEVTFGIGIQCGPAVVGNIGCESRMDYTAIGDTVNTASRLESNARAGQILISSDVYERVKEFILAEPIGKLTLKGKAQEIDTYQVNGLIGKEATE